MKRPSSGVGTDPPSWTQRLNPALTVESTTDEIALMIKKLSVLCTQVRGPIGFSTKPFKVGRRGTDLLIKVPPMSHIPLEDTALVASLSARLPNEDGERLRAMSKLLSNCTNVLYHHYKNHMLRLFEPHAAAAARRPVLIQGGKAMTPAELRDSELSFLREFLVTMIGANFNILTGVEYEAALAEAYLITMPVRVAFEGIETNLISRLWGYDGVGTNNAPGLAPTGLSGAAHEAQAALMDALRLAGWGPGGQRFAPSGSSVHRDVATAHATCLGPHGRFARLLPEETRDRVLIFHRGITQLKNVDVALGEKIDLLFEYIVMSVVKRLVWYTVKLFTCGQRPKHIHWMPDLDHLIDQISEGRMSVSEFVRDAEMQDTFARQGSMPPSTPSGAGGRGPMSPGPEVTRTRSQLNMVAQPQSGQSSLRRTFKRALPTVAKVLANLFKPVTIYEPAFRELIIVFRRRHPSDVDNKVNNKRWKMEDKVAAKTGQKPQTTRSLPSHTALGMSTADPRGELEHLDSRSRSMHDSGATKRRVSAIKQNGSTFKRNALGERVIDVESRPGSELGGPDTPATDARPGSPATPGDIARRPSMFEAAGKKGGSAEVSDAAQILVDLEDGVEASGMSQSLVPVVYDFRHNIFIKSFRNVPMADLEMVMPEKKVLFDGRTIFVICCQVSLALAVGAYSIYSAVTDKSSGTTDAIISPRLVAVLAFCFALIVRAQIAVYSLLARRGKSTTTLMTSIFRSLENTQEGVVLKNLRVTEQEQHKEDILVYYTLIRVGDNRSVTVAELDELCEVLLNGLFEARVDVDIRKIVDRLQQYGLVDWKEAPAEEGGGLVTALPLDEAVTKMTGMAKAVSAMSEKGAVQYVRQMLVDDEDLKSEGWGLDESQLAANERLITMSTSAVAPKSGR